jgi:two-component system, OmpR family, alkaline phosphatase synthesis response regulator PhoP
MHNLIVCDGDRLAAGALVAALEPTGFHLTVVYTADECLVALQCERIDLVLLGWSTDDGTAPDILVKLREERPHVPVIVIGNLGIEMEEVAALKRGANDFVARSCGVLALTERIRLRSLVTKPTDHAATLVIDVARRTVLCSSSEVNLTVKEFDLLCALVRGDGAVLSRADLLQQVWHAPPDLKTKTVDFHVRRLRSKLAEAGIAGAIAGARGIGFAWAFSDCHLCDTRPDGGIRPRA